MPAGWRRVREAPVHRRLHDELLERIRRGELRPGDRFPSENEIIAAYGVSSTTARRALYDLTREGFLVRVRGKGSFVADVKGKESRPVVGVLFPTHGVSDKLLDDFYFGRVLQGVREVVEEAQGSTLLLSLPIVKGEMAAVESYARLAAGHPDLTHLAVIAPPASHRPGLAWLAKRREEGGIGPLMVVAGARWEDLPVLWVDTDNVASGREVARYLADLGHRRIGGIFGLEEEANSLDRALGFKEELAARGLPIIRVRAAGDGGQEAGGESPQEGFVWVAHRPGEEVWPDTFARETAAAWLQRPPGERPTAIFAGGQGLAIGVLRAARQLGFRIPADLSVVGFDDALSLHWLEVFDPPLTTVRQPLVALGRAAALLLRLTGGERGQGKDGADGLRIEVDGTTVVARRHGERGWLLPNELVLRGSAGRPPESK